MMRVSHPHINTPDKNVTFTWLYRFIVHYINLSLRTWNILAEKHPGRLYLGRVVIDVGVLVGLLKDNLWFAVDHSVAHNCLRGKNFMLNHEVVFIIFKKILT